jgi:hypothetical protein
MDDEPIPRYFIRLDDNTGRWLLYDGFTETLLSRWIRSANAADQCNAYNREYYQR